MFLLFLLSVCLSLCQNDVKTLKKWMEDVDVFLNEEWPALGDSEALEKQLEQCTVRIKKLHPVITVDLFQKQQITVVTKNKLPEFIEAYFLIYLYLKFP